jgi:hypothetical protein
VQIALQKKARGLRPSGQCWRSVEVDPPIDATITSAQAAMPISPVRLVDRRQAADDRVRHRQDRFAEHDQVNRP